MQQEGLLLVLKYVSLCLKEITREHLRSLFIFPYIHPTLLSIYIYIYDVYIHIFMNTVACLIFSVNRVTNQNIQIITKRNCYSNCCYYHVWVRMCVENAWKEWFHNGWVVVDVTDLSSQNEFADIQRLFLLPCFTYM